MRCCHAEFCETSLTEAISICKMSHTSPLPLPRVLFRLPVHHSVHRWCQIPMHLFTSVCNVDVSCGVLWHVQSPHRCFQKQPPGVSFNAFRVVTVFVKQDGLAQNVSAIPFRQCCALVTMSCILSQTCRELCCTVV